MLLEYAGRTSGRTYRIPIGYFAVDDDEVISFSSTKWWTNLRDGRHVRLLIWGRWHEATPVVAEQTEEKATLLSEFVQRHGPRVARRLLLGLPEDRAPTPAEIHRAAERTAIIRFSLTTEQDTR